MTPLSDSTTIDGIGGWFAAGEFGSRSAPRRESGIKQAESARDLARLDLEVARSAETGKWLAFYDAAVALEKARLSLLKQTGALLAALHWLPRNLTRNVALGIPACVIPSSFWNHEARRRPAARLFRTLPPNGARPFSRYTHWFVRCLLLAGLFLTGCAGLPEAFPPPIQRNSPAGPEINPVGHFVSMNGPAADAHIVRDIALGLEAGAWRWTGQRPELRFRLSSVEGLRFTMDFALPDVTFAQRGPVAISFFINGHLLGKAHCEEGGQKRFEKAVPPGWLRTDADTLVAAEIDKVWIAPADGARLGFILSRAGFIE